MRSILAASGCLLLAFWAVLLASWPVLRLTALQVGARGALVLRASRPVRWLLWGPSGTLFPLYEDTGTVLHIAPGVDWPSGRYTLVADDGISRLTRTVLWRRNGVDLPGVTPRRLEQHYGLTYLYALGLTGRGVHVAIYTPAAPSRRDLTNFDRLFGLPAVSLSYVSCDPTDASSASAVAEADADVEWVHVAAPAAHVDLYCPYGNAGPDISSLGSAPAEAALNGDAAFSISFEWLGMRYRALWNAGSVDPDLLLPIPVNHPISVFVASGDTGVVRDAWPQDDPHVVTVGGTMWGRGPDRYWQDGAIGGGYGLSSWPKPSWQLLPGRYRRIPDVSMNASDFLGVYDGRISISEGTSFAAPIWAGIWALLAQDARATEGAAIGWANPMLYRLAESPFGSLAFPDTGSSPDGSAHYDPRIGFGAPDVLALDRLLVHGGALFPAPLYRRDDLAYLNP